MTLGEAVMLTDKLWEPIVGDDDATENYVLADWCDLQMESKRSHLWELPEKIAQRITKLAVKYGVVMEDVDILLESESIQPGKSDTKG